MAVALLHESTKQPREAMMLGGLNKKPLYLMGYKDGQHDMRKQVLDLLQMKIMDPELERDSPRYAALIELTREMSAEAR
jgi:hypothetical protein